MGKRVERAGRMSMRVAILEDEAVVSERLERFVREVLGEGLAGVHLLSALGEARDYLSSHPIDLLFLDLNLSGEDGFDLLAEAVAGSFSTIVVSAHHDQALRAFELGVTDFIPKPFDRQRVAQGLARLQSREPGLRQKLKKLAVRTTGRLDLVEVDHLLFVRGARDYAALHTSDGATHFHEKSLTALEQMLPPRFVRVHRSYLVDTERVRSLQSFGGGRHRLILQGDHEIPVSRERVARVRELLSEE